MRPGRIVALGMLWGAAWLTVAPARAIDLVLSYDTAVPANLRPAIERAAVLWESWVTNAGSGNANTVEIRFQYAADAGVADATNSWFGFAGSRALTPAQYMVQGGLDKQVTDGVIRLGSGQSWYTGLDGRPGSGQFDTVTVALHEIGHLMGMTASYGYEASGRWGVRDTVFGTYYLTRWDAYLRDREGDAPAAYPASESFGESTDGPTFVGPLATAANAGRAVPVCGPLGGAFQPGSSLVHVDQAGPSAPLMLYYLATGVARQGLYDYEVGVFRDLGWNFATFAEVHAAGLGNEYWQHGAAYREGLPPTAATTVYVDAAAPAAYDLIVSKDSSAAGVVVTGVGRLRVESGLLSLSGDCRNDATVQVDPYAKGGSLTCARFYTGYNGTATAVQKGGTLTATTGLYLGQAAAAQGTCTLDAGAVTAAEMTAGVAGRGTFRQNGGTVAVAGALVLGSAAGSTGAYDLAGGALTVGGTLRVGADGTGTFTWTAGSLTVPTVAIGPAGRWMVGLTAALAGALQADGGTLEVASGRTFTLAGPLAQTADGRTLTKTGAGTLVVSGPAALRAAGGLAVAAGTARLEIDVGAGGARPAVGVTGGGVLEFGATQHLATLNVAAGSARLLAGGDRLLVTQALALGPASSLDLAAHALVLDYAGGAASPAASVREWLRTGWTAGTGGPWSGPGLVSSSARADPAGLTALGVIENADAWLGGRTAFAGETVDATSILVKYTYWGDADLDGDVDFDDYDVIDYYYWFPPSAADAGWWTGDFDYDGDVDFDDYDKIDYAYWFQGGPLSAGGAGGAAAPEPATLALVLAGVAGLWRAATVRSRSRSAR